MFILLSLACSDKASNTDDTAFVSDDTATQTMSAWTEERSNEILEEITTTICAQINSCCDDSSQEIYFSSYLGNANLEEFHQNLPPNATLSAEECPTILVNMLEKSWFGSWSDAILRDEVSFLEAEYSQCMDALQNATCGEDLQKELFNGTCFGFQAPAGGEDQRVFFSRNQTENETCQPIADGFGGLYYGSCDQNTSFCCLPTESGCNPFPILNEAGICQRASQEGESCSIEDPIQLCASGLDCDYATSICIAPDTTLLTLGETCYNPSSYEVLGDCEDSWCDLFGSAACEPLKQEGEECLFPESCSSGYCDSDSSTCSSNDFCDL